MTTKTHEIVHFTYLINARMRVVEKLQMWSAAGKVADVVFVDDMITVPLPKVAMDLNSVKATFRRSTFPGLAEMLTNENPVTITVNSRYPGFMCLSTFLEPFGVCEQ